MGEHKRPKHIIFKRIFENQQSLEDHSDQAEKTELLHASSDFDAEWNKYWLESGDEIVYSSWVTLYGDYIDSDCEQLENLIENINLDETNIPSSSENIEIAERSVSSDWLDLWEKHYEEQYSKCFDEWFDGYGKALRIFEGTEYKKLKNKNEYVNIDESKDLEALGLPTTFVGGARPKIKEKPSKPYFEHFSDDDDQSGTLEDQVELKDYLEIMDGIFMEDEMENTNKTDDKEEIFQPQSSTSEANPKRKRKTKNRNSRKIPSYIIEDKSLLKYWKKRYLLFSRFEQGIQLDRESWFSVTPEKIAIHIAEKLKNHDIIIDAFCGSGGNAIQFAKNSKKVIAIDIDPKKIEMAKNNAKVYEVEKNIEFIIGDFLILCDGLIADAVFLSPPWGGPKYSKNDLFDIEKNLKPVGATALLEKARKITNNIGIYLPRSSDIKQIIKMAGVGGKVEIEQNYFDNKIVALTAFYGGAIEDG